MVIARARDTSLRLFSMSAWWAQVTVTPEARRRPVLKSGLEKVFTGSIPIGGQIQPTSGVGARLL